MWADNCQKLTKFANEQSQSRSPHINAFIKIGENPFRFTQVIVLKVKYECIVGR